MSFRYADKLTHLLIFAALAATTRWRFGGRWLPLALAAGYAVVSEVAQGLLLSERSGDPLDVIADLVGITLGWVLADRALRGS